jgi:nucleoid-associated protein YgaU
MPSFPAIAVRQPQPYDLVDDPVAVCGVGTGFEGQFAARVRDGNGEDLAEVPIMAGGAGSWRNFHAEVPIGIVPATPQGTIEFFDPAQGGGEIFTVVVPIVFGRALIDPYFGFAQHRVVAGDTLSAIAQQVYGDPALWPRIFEANRDQILNPNLIFPGQVLRIPQ